MYPFEKWLGLYILIILLTMSFLIFMAYRQEISEEKVFTGNTTVRLDRIEQKIDKLLKENINVSK